MKIVFINRYYYPDHSATSQLLTDLATHLAAEGREVHVVASRQCYDDPGADLSAEATADGVAIHRAWTTRFGRRNLPGRALDYLSFYFSSAILLMRLAKRGDVIVAKTDPPLISVVAWLCVRIRGARLVNWIQDLFPEVATALGVRGLAGSRGRLVRAARTRTLKSAAVNVVLGELMAGRLRGEGVPESKIEIIPNWVDGIAIRPMEKNSNPLRRSWGLQDKFIVGYSGNMGRAHEFETIMQAATLLRDDSMITFLFIGDGHGRASIERAAATAKLTNVLFKPYQPREALGASLTLPDVHLVSLRPELEGLVLPSKFYGIVAAGRPAIFVGSAEGELAMEINRSACGAVIKPGDASALSSLLKKLENEPALAAAMGKRARECFESRYDKRLATARWDKMFASLS